MIGNATDRMDGGIDNGNICDNCASPTQHPPPGPDQLIQPQVLSNPAKSRRVTAHADGRALCIVTTPQSPTLQWFHRDKTLRGSDFASATSTCLMVDEINKCSVYWQWTRQSRTAGVAI